MPDPGQIGEYVTGFWQNNVFTSILSYTSYIVSGVLILAIMTAVYFLIQYKYKIRYHTVMQSMEGMKDGDAIPISEKTTWDLARPVKHKGGDKWRLLLARKLIEPVSFKHIKQGNRIRMIRTGTDAFVPVHHNVKFQLGDHVLDEIMPIKANIKFWEQTNIKQAGLETVSDNQSKQLMFYFTVCVIAIVVIVAFVTWLMLSQARGAVGEINFLAEAVKGLQGTGPG